jgi:ATP-binding cassette subfamily B protein
MLSGSYSTIHSYLLKTLIDTVSNTSNEALFKATLLPALLFIINAELLNDLAWRGVDYINIKIAPKIKSYILEELLGYVQQHSYRFFQDNFTGTVTNNIQKLADNIEKMVHNISLFLVRGFTQFLLALITMGILVHPVFSAALFIWIALFVSLSIIYSNKIVALADQYADSEVQVAGQISDSITSVTSVKLFAREKHEKSYLKQYLNNLIINYLRKEWFVLKLLLTQGLSITALIGIMVFALIKLKTLNLVTAGDFAFILGLTMYVTENMWWLMEQIDAFNGYRGQCNQSLKMLIIPHEITDKENAKPLVVTKGEIKFEDVSFNYLQSDGIFKNESITIPSGQKVGLVGFSGSGKTTFVNLIVRMFDVSSGIITIDGQDIASVTQCSLRENIGFIPQDPVLFHRSLRANIRYGKIGANDDEVIAAAKRAHAHEFVMETAEGYDSLVGERGIKLSGGQRQRIAIARAILKNAQILILDEATSALDSVTESQIQDSLYNLMKNKTVLVIAHRLSTLLSMDRILVFNKGKIVEDGAHDELLNKEGLYATLWHSQVGGFLIDKKDFGMGL